MAVTTAAGTTLSIGTTAANPSGDTYTLIGEVVTIPTFGRIYQLITHTPINTRKDQKFKGSYNEGSVTIDLGLDLSDAGQLAARTASRSDDDYNFELEYPTGEIQYLTGKVMSFNTNINSVNNIIGAQIMIELTDVTDPE